MTSRWRVGPAVWKVMSERLSGVVSSSAGWSGTVRVRVGAVVVMRSCSVRGRKPVISKMRAARASRGRLCRRTRCGPYWHVRAWSRCVLRGCRHARVGVCRGQVVGRSMWGLSKRIRDAVMKSWLLRGVMPPVGAWSQAPAPVPHVEWWTAMARASSVLLRAFVWELRMRLVSCFCWRLGMAVSGVISDVSVQSVGPMLLVAVWSCVFALGSSSRSAPMVAWPVWVRMAGALGANWRRGQRL